MSRELQLGLILGVGLLLASTDIPYCQTAVGSADSEALYNACFTRNTNGTLVRAVSESDPLFEACRPLFRSRLELLGENALFRLRSFRDTQFQKTGDYALVPLRSCREGQTAA